MNQMKMQPEEFDEILRHSAENERRIPFDEDAWQGLAGRLSAVQPLLAEQNQRRRRWAVALPWGLLLPMFAWNLWLQTGISELQTTVSQQTEMLQTSLVARRDTLRETRIETIVQRDTIWLSAPATAFLASSRGSVFEQNEPLGASSRSSFSQEGLGGESSAILAKTNDAETAAPVVQNLDNQQDWPAVECLPTLPVGLLEHSRHQFFLWPEHEFFPETVKKTRPRPSLTTTLGAGGSMVVGNLNEGWQGFETDFQLGFGPRNGWSAVLGLQRRWGKFLPKDGSLHEVLPTATPTNPADELHHANANFRWLALAPGIQRSWQIGARANGFAAAGITADFARKARYNYEFESSLDPGTIYSIPFSGSARGVEITRFWLQMGLRRDLKRGYFWQATLTGRAAFRQSAYFPEQNFLPWAQVGIGRIW